LACQVPGCLCPVELGGTTYFEDSPAELPDWMPTVDHHPKTRAAGGRLSFDNVRLAHRLCNRVVGSASGDIDPSSVPARELARDGTVRGWTAAIVSPHGVREIRDARAMSDRGRRPNIRFENSRPGSWIAGVVTIPGVGDVTCISLYGLMDELSEASVHRSLSD